MHPIIQRMCGMCGMCSNSPKEGVTTSGSIVHVDPIQFKMQTAYCNAYNISKPIPNVGINVQNGHQKRRHSGVNGNSKNQSNPRRSSQGGVTNKGYEASDL